MIHRPLSTLASETFDLLIIGGGILGAGTARDAAMRGLRVALVDKGDYASGTSSRSSKLIHGGFRYLEQRAFGLVAESCRERSILQRIAPHLVHPLPLLLPVYERDPRSLLLMRLGMTLYDLLALYRNPAPHQTWTPRRLRRAEPALNPAGLRGGIRFFDCQEDDARLCLDNLIHAIALGAKCANYCEIEGFTLPADGRITTARAIDHLTGNRFEIRAKVLINATGPWAERVASLAGGSPGDASIALAPTKGVHLLLPRLTGDHGLFFQARRDGRMMFILPWHDCTLVGTTDTDLPDDPSGGCGGGAKNPVDRRAAILDDLHADPAEVDYLLSEVNALLPASKITRRDVIATIAGARPLLRGSAGGGSAPSSRSREHRIVRRDNFISVAGGKYTTYRAITAEVVDEAYRALGRRPAACRTATAPLPSLRPPPAGARLADSPTIHASDILHACEHEQAASVADVMYRRTGLALSRFCGADVAETISRLMAVSLGWSEATRRQSINAYLAERQRNLQACSSPLLFGS